MKKKLAFKAVVLIVFTLLVSSELITPEALATSETRYFQYNTWYRNGLWAYALNTTALGSLSRALTISVYDGNVIVDQFLGIRVWVRASAGNETEITSGTSVGIATGNNSGEFLGSWSCPQTTLKTTDLILVKIYAEDASPPSVFKANFTTEQLGVTVLNSASWTIYYHIGRAYNSRTRLTTYTLYWGSTTYDSRVANFTYGEAAGGETTILTVQQLASAYGQFSTRKKMYSVKQQLVSSYQQFITLKTLRQTVQQIASAYQQIASFHRVILIAQQLATAISQFTTTKTLTTLAQTVAETYQELHSIKSLYNTFQQLASVFQSIETKSRHEVILIVSQLAEAVSQFATSKIVKPTFQQLAQAFGEFVTSLPILATNEGMAIIFAFIILMALTSGLLAFAYQKRRRIERHGHG